MRSISSIMQEHYYGNRRRMNPVPADAVPKMPLPCAPIQKWDRRKQMALLLVERSQCALDCIEHLKPKGLWPRQEDFAQLRSEGLIFKRDVTARFHELTPTGHRYAMNVAWLVASELKLHHVKQEHGLGSNVSAKCTCGWFKSFERKWGGESAKLERAINQHNADPGAWLREREQASTSLQRALTAIEQSAGGRNG